MNTSNDGEKVAKIVCMFMGVIVFSNFLNACTSEILQRT